MSDEVVQKIGRGGAGNMVTRKELEDAAKHHTSVHILVLHLAHIMA